VGKPREQNKASPSDQWVQWRLHSGSCQANQGLQSDRYALSRSGSHPANWCRF